MESCPNDPETPESALRPPRDATTQGLSQLRQSQASGRPCAWITRCAQEAEQGPDTRPRTVARQLGNDRLTHSLVEGLETLHRQPAFSRVILQLRDDFPEPAPLGVAGTTLRPGRPGSVFVTVTVCGK